MNKNTRDVTISTCLEKFLTAENLLSDLFNGNIAAMMTEHKHDIFGTQTDVSLYGYKYDQLHRIRNGNYYGFRNGMLELSSDRYHTSYNYDPDGNLTTLNRMGVGELMDGLEYYYENSNRPNQLNRVKEINGTSTAPGQFQGTEEYTYDAIGNLIQNNANGINTTINWDVYNKVKSVSSPTGDTRYLYDGAGNRVYSHANGVIRGYVRDAQGNTMSVYDLHDDGNPFFTPIALETYIYGSNRIGVDNTIRTHPRLIVVDEWHKDLTTTHYEISNHLGNVLTTVTGRKLGQPDPADPEKADHYLPEVVTATDYYAFGQTMPGRTYTNTDLTGTNGYRYAFNGNSLCRPKAVSSTKVESGVV